MRRTYTVLAWVVAAGVVVQAAAIAFGFGGMTGYVMDGGVVDKALIESEQATFTGDLGFPIHGIVGGLVLPVVGFVMGVVSFFVRGVRRAKLMAWGVFALIFVQGSLGYSIADVPYVGLVHGANAFAVLALAVVAARRSSRPQVAVPVRETDAGLLV